MKGIGLDKFYFIGILYLIVISCLVAWGFSYDNWQLREHLKWVSPLFLEINFVFIIIGVIANLEIFRVAVRKITVKTWAFVLLIAIGGTLVTMFAAPRIHRIYYDEDIYLNVAQNISDLKRAGMCNDGGTLYGKYFCNRLEYNKDPNGWPYLASLLFRVVGPSHLACFILNNVVLGLSILVVFFTGFFLFDSPKSGLYGALIYALIPEGLIWSNTTAAEPGTALFAGLALMTLVLFTRNLETRSLLLASVLFAFAFQFRPESALIILPGGLILLLLSPDELAKKRIYVSILLLLVLILPHIIHIYSVRGSTWGAPDGIKFALKYFKPNFYVNALFYLKNIRFPLFFTLLFFVGMLVPIIKSERRRGAAGTWIQSFFLREKSILLIWFLTFWGIFLFFYAGSYNYGADVRFSLLSYMPLAVMAGYGAFVLNAWLSREWAGSVLTVIILFCALSFFPFIRAETQEAWGARADHRYAEEMAKKLPDDSLILTHNPNMFLLWGKNAAQASIITNEHEYLKFLLGRYKGGIYFHYNFWCNVSDPLQQSFCEKILQQYKATEIVAFQEQDYRYVLYRLSMEQEN